MASPLELFVKSNFFVFIGLVFIVLNGFVLAIYDPKKDANEPHYFVVLNLFVDSYFCAEFLVFLAAYGAAQFKTVYRLIDSMVAAVSLGDIILFIVNIYTDKGSDARKYLQVIRVVSILRPLSVLKVLPGDSSGHEALLSAAYDLVLNVVIPLAALLVFCLLSFGLVGDALQYRCVPVDFSAPAVVDNADYQAYGLNYFLSQYNVDFCGYAACDAGFACQNLHMPFAGSFADFSDPWVALVSNMSFVTMRGWPNVFWAIHDTAGVVPAVVILATIVTLGSLLVFNMFIAVLVGFFKLHGKHWERLTWISAYPGNLETVTELELLLWAKRNVVAVEAVENTQGGGLSVRNLLGPIFSQLCCFCCRKKPDDAVTIEMQLLKNKSEKKFAPTVIDDEATEAEPVDLHNERKIRFLVPNCLSFKVFRKQIRHPFSGYNLVFLALISLNILVFAMESTGINATVKQVVEYSNIGFAAIFALEIVISLFVMGPVLFFNSLFNLLDTFCVIFALFSLGYSGGCKFINIFRIFRIFRPVPTEPRGTLAEERQKRRVLRDTSLHFVRLTEMLYRAVKPMVMYFTVQYAAIFLFAIVGMRIFPFHYGDSTTPANSAPLNGTSSLVLLQETWSGQYQSALDFNIFVNAYSTVYSLMYLNSWYFVMVGNLLKSGQASFWYFFVWIFLSNFLLAPVLVATLTVGIEQQAVILLRAIAKENKGLFDRVQYYRTKTQLHRAFQLFKHNTRSAGGEEDAAAPRVAGANELDEEEEEEVDRDSCCVKLAKERSTYSLLLFSPNGYIRRFAHWLMSSALLNVLVFAAVVITVIAILKTHPSDNQQLDNALRLFVIVVFFGEMFVKWVALGLVGVPGAYFHNPFNAVDFLLNLVIIYTYTTGDYQYTPFLIVRISKVPAMIRYVTRSKSLGLLYVAVNKSAKSVAVITAMILGLCLFFAVYGLNLWKGGFGQCSFADYPHGRNRYATDASFPHGCNNGTYTTYDSSTGLYTEAPLEWVLPVDHFDDIFHACKSVFRVVMMNDWAGIMLSATSYTGSGYQPSPNASRAGFLYFVMLSAISTVFNILFAGVIYFHYYIEVLMDGRAFILTQDEVIWLQLEVGLRHVEPYHVPRRPDPAKAPVRAFLHGLTHNLYYRVFSVLFAFVPVVLLLGFYGQTYATDTMLYVDNLFSAFYILDYLMRVAVAGRVNFCLTTEGQQELLVVAALGVSIVAIVMAWSRGQELTFVRSMTTACIMVRMYRLSAVFPQIAKFFRIFGLVLKGFLPMVLSMLALLLFYGVIGFYAFRHVSVDYGDAFLNQHYNFTGFFRSCVTLFAMATGNMYTEVLDALKAGAPFQERVAVELFFTSYYILMNVLLKSVIILLISKFLNQGGESAGTAEEQISHFQRMWRKVQPTKSNPRLIKMKRLGELLTRLKAPLGIKGRKDSHNFMVIDRFRRKVLTFVPSAAEEEDERLAYMVAHGGVGDPKWSDPKAVHEHERKKMFDFRDILLAVHKLFVVGSALDDDAAFEESRLVHKQRLKLLRLQLLLLVLSGRGKDFKDPTVRASQLQLMLQRFDPALYQETFVRLMTHTLHFLQQTIQSLGFEDFDGFVVIYMRKAVRNEFLAAELQLKKFKLLNPRSSRTDDSQAAVDAATRHFAAVTRLNKQFDAIYNRHIKQLWKISSLRRVVAIPEKKACVTALALDAQSNFYVAFDSGKVKVWRNNAYNGLVDEATLYRPAQVLDLGRGSRLQSLMISADAKRLYVGKGYSVVVFTLSAAKKKKRAGFVESGQLSFHSDTVNSIVAFEKYVLTGSKDGYVALWPNGGDTPLQSYYTGSSVFCMTVMPVREPNTVVDELHLSDVLICGLKAGNLAILPLPLARQGAKEGAAWNSISVAAGNSPVSAVCVAWSFVYVGCSDGSIIVFACKVVKTAETLNNPVAMVQLARVSFQPVHSGPVTGLQYSGGHLFSCSHDFSLLPWVAPAKLSAQTENEFRQDMVGGKVFHSCPIIAMAANGKVVVTGDEDGNVVVCAPSKSSELLKSDAFVETNGAKHKCHFSFLEHDFKECAVLHKGVAMAEEVYLNVCNVSDKPVTVRVIPKASHIFHAGYDEALNTSSGCPTISLPSRDSGVKKTAMAIPANFSGQFRLTFSPIEAERVYSGLVEFVVDESAVVKIAVKGIGIKPLVRLDGESRVLDFGLGQVGAAPQTMTVKLFNPTKRDLAVNVNDSPVKDEYSAAMHTLASRGLSVHPNCFVVRRQRSVEVQVTFAPTRSMISVDLPLKFTVAGAPYIVAMVRTRAQRKSGGDAPADSASQSGAKPETTANDDRVSIGDIDLLRLSSLGAHAKKYPGLRLLSKVENTCPGCAVNALLSGVGWGVSYGRGMLCLMHLASGLFFSIPRGEHATEDDEENSVTHRGLGTAAVNDTVEVQFLCSESLFYELLLCGRLLEKGHCLKDKLCKVRVKAADLFRVDAHGRAVELYGVQVLELRISTASDGLFANVSSVTHINVQKGYEVQAPVVTTQDFRLVDRLDIVGIHRIATILQRDAEQKPCVVLTENFDQMNGDGEVDGEASSIFGAVRVALTPTAGATHYEVRDVTTLCNLKDGARISDAVSTLADAFNSADTSTQLSLAAPKVRIERETMNGTVRDLSISLLRKTRDDKGKLVNGVADVVTGEVHTMKYASMAPGATSGNVTVAKNALNCILPSAVHSCKHSVAVCLASSSEADTHFTVMQNQIRSGFDSNLEAAMSIHNGRWVFVLDKSTLKLVSANPNWPMAVDPNAEQPDDLTVASSKRSKKSRASKAPAAPAAEDSPPPFSNMELQFTSHGMLVVLDNVGHRNDAASEHNDAASVTSAAPSVSSLHSTIQSSVSVAAQALGFDHVMQRVNSTMLKVAAGSVAQMTDSGVVLLAKSTVTRARRLSDLPVDKASIGLTWANYTGETTRLHTAPHFLSHMWQQVSHDVLVEETKASFRSLAAKQQAAARTLNDKATAPGVKHTSVADVVYEVLAALTSEHYLKVTESDKEVKRPAKSTAKTPAKDPVFSFAQLEIYLETVALPGNEAPMSKARVESVLRALQRDMLGQVSRDNFRHWFEVNGARRDLTELNDRTIFARLLAEELDSVLAVSLDNSGAALTADMLDEEQPEPSGHAHSVDQTLVRLDTSASTHAERGARRVKMASLWDQRHGRVARRVDSVLMLSKSTSRHLGLSDHGEAFRMLRLRQLQQHPSSKSFSSPVPSPPASPMAASYQSLNLSEDEDDQLRQPSPIPPLFPARTRKHHVVSDLDAEEKEANDEVRRSPAQQTVSDESSSSEGESGSESDSSSEEEESGDDEGEVEYV